MSPTSRAAAVFSTRLCPPESLPTIRPCTTPRIPRPAAACGRRRARNPRARLPGSPCTTAPPARSTPTTSANRCARTGAPAETSSSAQPIPPADHAAGAVIGATPAMNWPAARTAGQSPRATTAASSFHTDRPLAARRAPLTGPADARAVHRASTIDGEGYACGGSHSRRSIGMLMVRDQVAGLHRPRTHPCGSASKSTDEADHKIVNDPCRLVVGSAVPKRIGTRRHWSA